MSNTLKTIILAFAIFTSACGPITAHSSIAKAKIAIDAAHSAQADQFAIYEYERAVQCLRKAKEEEGYSSFQKANDLAQEAVMFADKAKGRALNRKGAPK
jgi:hypothetical protein